MFCKESLGEFKFRAFLKRVGPRFPSLESIDYFGTSEHYMSGQKKIGRCNFSLYATGSCDEHAVYFRR